MDAVIIQYEMVQLLMYCMYCMIILNFNMIIQTYPDLMAYQRRTIKYFITTTTTTHKGYSVH